MTWVSEELVKAQQIRLDRAKAQAVETVAVAQAALELAKTRYENRPTSSRAYDISAAQDRVAAAQAREPVAPRLMCPELRREWQAAGGI